MKKSAELKETHNDKLLKAIDENTFYSKMAMKKAGHVGVLFMTMNTMELVRRKGRVKALTETLFTVATVMCLADDVEVLIHELRKRKGGLK